MTVTAVNTATRPADVATRFDVARVRADFPILLRKAHKRSLVYLDSAATGQKPQAVIDAVANYYSSHNANVHRGVHLLSQEATEAYEGAREKTRRFINAGGLEEVVFTSGTTESVNLVAQAYGRPRLKPGDEILISHLEHHSNIVPWQLLCGQTGAVLKVAPINQRGEIIPESYAALLNQKTRIVALNHISNALGTINPVKKMIAQAHQVDAVVLLDGAQAVPHLRVDVRDLDVDFYAFSGHKMFGPTGIGVLYGRERLLQAMPPWMGGGDMIRYVTFDKTDYNELPYKFEAGTPNIAGAVGLGAAVDYLESIGLDAIAAYEQDLLTYGTEALEGVPGLTLIGTAAHKAGVLSFVLAGVHPHDLGTILDHEGVAVRTGHHCAQPVMDFFGVPATARASLAFYNNREDIDRLVEGLHKVREVFG